MYTSFTSGLKYCSTIKMKLLNKCGYSTKNYFVSKKPSEGMRDYPRTKLNYDLIGGIFGRGGSRGEESFSRALCIVIYFVEDIETSKVNWAELGCL